MAFPVDVNRATRERMLRIPGLGVKNVDRILQIRRWHRLQIADLVRLRVPTKKALPFLITADHTPHLLEQRGALASLAKPRQMELFGVPAAA